MRIKLKDITLKNIKYFLQGNFYLVLEKLEWLKLIFPHYKEQFEFRNQRVLKIHPECIKNKACINCGCTTPGLFLASKECELGCFPKMMGKSEWLNSKERIEYLNNTK